MGHFGLRLEVGVSNAHNVLGIKLDTGLIGVFNRECVDALDANLIPYPLESIGESVYLSQESEQIMRDYNLFLFASRWAISGGLRELLQRALHASGSLGNIMWACATINFNF